ncbi:signal peptidase I [Rothia sp. CCM 9418]|uniref:signal peptidase I n=1 Tax=Rothia sp. CCM 9418 TaxID=3402661 RepID=UPI003AE92344
MSQSPEHEEPQTLNTAEDVVDATFLHQDVPPAEQTGFLGQVKEFGIVILYALVIAFILKTFVIRGFYIPSGSMENTLEVNDRVFVNVAGSMFSQAERGDIIVFKDTQGWIDSSPHRSNPVASALAFVGILPDSSDKYLVKRVIGVGGDHVVCCSANGRIMVNGVAIDETYLYPGAKPSEIPFDVIVPENSYFVMGDHRNNSADSRYHIEDGHEFISDSDVEGKVFVRAWPLNRFQFIGGAHDVFADVPRNKASEK